MAKIGIKLVNNDLRIVDKLVKTTDLSTDEYIVYEDPDDGTIGCSKAVILPSCVVIERETLKSVKFVRTANDADIIQLTNKRLEEKKALSLCRSKVELHNLPMRLIDAVYTFDFSRLTFYFSSPGRVDFRKLLKDITGSFRKTRIMLKQIGAREEAKFFNGVGTCGRTLCCGSCLNEFPFITMQMAKNQNLPPNPSKLTGLCSKLKCCLSYEDSFYNEEKSRMPSLDTYVETINGIAKVLKQEPLSSMVHIKYYESESIEIIRLDEIKAIDVLSPEQFEKDFSELDEY